MLSHQAWDHSPSLKNWKHILSIVVKTRWTIIHRADPSRMMLSENLIQRLFKLYSGNFCFFKKSFLFILFLFKEVIFFKYCQQHVYSLFKNKNFDVESISERKGFLSCMPTRDRTRPWNVHPPTSDRAGWRSGICPRPWSWQGSFIQWVWGRKMKIVLQEFTLAVDKGGGAGQGRVGARGQF